MKNKTPTSINLWKYSSKLFCLLHTIAHLNTLAPKWSFFESHCVNQNSCRRSRQQCDTDDVTPVRSASAKANRAPAAMTATAALSGPEARTGVGPSTFHSPPPLFAVPSRLTYTVYSTKYEIKHVHCVMCAREAIGTRGERGDVGPTGEKGYQGERGENGTEVRTLFPALFPLLCWERTEQLLVNRFDLHRATSARPALAEKEAFRYSFVDTYCIQNGILLALLITAHFHTTAAGPDWTSRPAGHSGAKGLRRRPGQLCWKYSYFWTLI